MKKEWHQCKKILCIRPDNMGDLLMTSPAIKALKESFGCHITLLTSSMAKPITPFFSFIDDIIIFDLPWVKTPVISSNDSISNLVDKLKAGNYDGAILFTVYSQNPLPTMMIAWMAGIPLRLAYCRENPYQLLTDWIPDREPYSFVQHQVKRDCALVESIGALVTDESLQLSYDDSKWKGINDQLANIGISGRWIIMHTGVSEEKRNYPAIEWIKIAGQIYRHSGYKILLTGSEADATGIERLKQCMGDFAINLAGKLTLEEFIILIEKSPLVISVNTVAMHLAAAVKTPVIALYALSNPQHYPWKAFGKVFIYSVKPGLQSRNEVIRFAADEYHPEAPYIVDTFNILNEAMNIIFHDKLQPIPELETRQQLMQVSR